MGKNWEQTKNFSLYEILSVLFSVLSVYSAGSSAVSKAVTQHQGWAAALADLWWLRCSCVCVLLACVMPPGCVLSPGYCKWWCWRTWVEGAGMRRKGYSLVPRPGCAGGSARASVGSRSCRCTAAGCLLAHERCKPPRLLAGPAGPRLQRLVLLEVMSG